MASEIKVDTISEKTSANGVTIDGVSLKDSKVATANSIDSDTYVDGSIDAVHMSANSIDSDSYVDGSIDTVHIADDQITLAKMDGLARGKIIYGDSSGDPAALTVGSNGQALVSDGTDISWGSAGATLTGSTNNTVVTVTGSSAIAGEAKLLFDPPKLTIGNATAEDTLIVFDGNAQDWHIGLDDSADDFVIGLGSTLGTTSHIVIDETGAVTKPLQPAFLARLHSGTTDQTNPDADDTITFADEKFDTNADYNAGTYTFTAPVTGKYAFLCNPRWNNIPDDSDHSSVAIVTSNRTYAYLNIQPHNDTKNYISANCSILADMDAADTAYMKVNSASGTPSADLSYFSYWSGYLVG